MIVVSIVAVLSIVAAGVYVALAPQSKDHSDRLHLR